jgi:hypothetical protein
MILHSVWTAHFDSICPSQERPNLQAGCGVLGVPSTHPKSPNPKTPSQTTNRQTYERMPKSPTSNPTLPPNPPNPQTPFHPPPQTADRQTYERMTPLAVDEACLPNGWADVRPGDAVVAFSRQQLYHIRKAGGVYGGEVGTLDGNGWDGTQSLQFQWDGFQEEIESTESPHPTQRATRPKPQHPTWSPSSPPTRQPQTPNSAPQGSGARDGPPHLHRVRRPPRRDPSRAGAALQRPRRPPKGAVWGCHLRPFGGGTA